MVENRRILEDMRTMGRTRNTLTPMIGLSLAALVAGSLVTLAVLAQRVSLDVPLANPVMPHQTRAGATAPPLVVENPPPADVDDLPRQRDVDFDLPPDRVLPLRIAAPAAPGGRKPAKGPDGDGKPQKPKPDQRVATAGLPPGIIKKINRGGELPPGHARKVAAGAKRFPSGHSNGRGRGTCGEPPCGGGPSHDAPVQRSQSAGKSSGPAQSSSPGNSKGHGNAYGHSKSKGKSRH